MIDILSKNFSEDDDLQQRLAAKTRGAQSHSAVFCGKGYRCAKVGRL